MSPKEIFKSVESLNCEFYLKSYIFCLHFNPFLHVWIRIRIPNTDPYSEYGSGSMKLQNTDLIRIRIHNTDLKRYLPVPVVIEKEDYL